MLCASRISEASDAFSFGKVVLEMITGTISTIDNPFSDMFEDEESEKDYPIDVAFDTVSFFFQPLPSSPASHSVEITLVVTLLLALLLFSYFSDFCFINSQRDCSTY